MSSDDASQIAGGAELTFDIGKQRKKRGKCLVGAARLLVGGGEVVAGAEGVGVVGSEDALPVGEDLLVQGDGLVGAAATTLGRLAGLP